jgi:hypothetical protein
MMKQNAAHDASFWINACDAGLVRFLPDYFRIFVCGFVALGRSELDLSAAARHAGISVYHMLSDDRA